MLVFRRPPGTNPAERMIGDMGSLPRLLADFGRQAGPDTYAGGEEDEGFLQRLKSALR